MKKALLIVGYCIVAVAFFFILEVIFNGGLGQSNPPATAESEQIVFENEDDLQAYMEELYAAEEATEQLSHLYNDGRSDGWREGYETGYDDGYLEGYRAGYEDGANGAEYWEP